MKTILAYLKKCIKPAALRYFFVTFVPFVILFIILSGSVKLQAQDTNSEIVNQTANISISTSINSKNNKVNIKYFIAAKFNKPSRGIFIALPKNQDGVWTNYEVVTVIKSSSAVSCNVSCADKLEWQNEKYEQINEWNEFRLRIGDKDTPLPIGYYFYGLEIEADYNPDLAYNFVFLQDWTEEIINNDITLFLDEQQICTNTGPNQEYANQAVCNKTRTSFLLNQTKPKSNMVISIWFNIWPYLLAFILINLLMLYLWYKFAKDNWGNQKLDRPEFEPPSIYPWQASFLISEGQVDLKNTLLSYILWLNNKKYIHLNFNTNATNTANVEDTINKVKRGSTKDLKSEITVKILKDLPIDLGLPAIYNTTINSIAELGLKEGILETKINPAEHIDSTKTDIKKVLNKFYTQKPFNEPIAWSVGIILFIFLVGLFTFMLIQDIFLIGNSWGSLLIGSLVFIAPGLTFLLVKWGKLNKTGIDIASYSYRYKYYLENVEKLKLDFSNNPKEGVQKYLVAVPFAASFGIMPKFQKYFANIIPNTAEIDSTSLIYTSYYAIAFYTPPSSDGGFSGGGGGGFSGGGGSW